MADVIADAGEHARRQPQVVECERGVGDLGVQGGFAEAAVPQRDAAGVVHPLGDFQGMFEVQEGGVRVVGLEVGSGAGGQRAGVQPRVADFGGALDGDRADGDCGLVVAEVGLAEALAGAADDLQDVPGVGRGIGPEELRAHQLTGGVVGAQRVPQDLAELAKSASTAQPARRCPEPTRVGV